MNLSQAHERPLVSVPHARTSPRQAPPPWRHRWLTLLAAIFARHGLAPQLLAGVLLFSSIVTLLLTSGQLYLDFRRDVGTIENRLDEIGRSYLPSLAEGLWNLDERQIKAQLDGILRLPDIRSARVDETAAGRSPLVIAVGAVGAQAAPSRDYPIVYRFRDSERAIGTLRVEATLTRVYDDLISRGLVILVSQGAKTFLVSIFIIYFVHWLITRHLATISAFMTAYNPRHGAPRLTLRRKMPRRLDELDQVTAAFNELCASLQGAYDELRESTQRFQDYAEIASDWFWETGPDHSLTHITQRGGLQITDYQSRLGLKRWEYASDVEEEAAKWHAHRRCLDAHEPFRGFVFRVTRADGAHAYISISGRPRFSPAGKFLGYRGISTDVTPMIRAERELREAKDREILHQTQKIKAEADRLELLQRLISAQEHERLRIARELHDQTGQDLVGLSLGLKSLEACADANERAKILLRLQALAAEMGGNLHKIALELRPTSLDDVGLLSALETYLAEWSRRFDVPVDFHTSGSAMPPLPPEIETTIYRIVQEALTNVVKHADADTVSVVLECHDAHLQVIIEDDGNGFDAESPLPRHRLGLAGIRERLTLIGGTLAIDSGPGQGTTLYIRVPLTRTVAA